MTKRIWYKYDFMVGTRIVHSGITIDPDRREREHKQRWPGGRLKIVGRAYSELAARAWEQTKRKTITPKR